MNEIHNFKKGDWVFIINQSAGGEFYIEGKGQIVAPVKTIEDRYKVRIKQRESWETYERYVDPNAQDDPYDFTSRLNAQLREAASR